MNYVIYGNSFSLVDLEIEKILCGRKPTNYSLAETDLRDLVRDFGYNSLFDEEKVIVLRDFDELCGTKKDVDKALEALEAYLKEPNEFVTLIMVVKDKSTFKGSLKKVIASQHIVETPIITKSYELVKIMGDEIRKSGYGISQNALNIFCEKCANNYDLAKKELQKLIQIKKGEKLITEDDVLKYVSNYNMTDSFGFKDAVINRDIVKAMDMLDDLEASKMELLPLVVMLAKEFQAIYNIKLLAEKKMNNDAIGKEMNDMHPYRVKLLREVSNKYTLEELKNVILCLCNLNIKLVSADNIGFDELRKLFLEI